LEQLLKEKSQELNDKIAECNNHEERIKKLEGELEEQIHSNANAKTYNTDLILNNFYQLLEFQTNSSISLVENIFNLINNSINSKDVHFTNLLHSLFQDLINKLRSMALIEIPEEVLNREYETNEIKQFYPQFDIDDNISNMEEVNDNRHELSVIYENEDSTSKQEFNTNNDTIQDVDILKNDFKNEKELLENENKKLNETIETYKNKVLKLQQENETKQTELQTKSKSLNHFKSLYCNNKFVIKKLKDIVETIEKERLADKKMEDEFKAYKQMYNSDRFEIMKHEYNDLLSENQQLHQKIEEISCKYWERNQETISVLNECEMLKNSLKAQSKAIMNSTTNNSFIENPSDISEAVNNNENISINENKETNVTDFMNIEKPEEIILDSNPTTLGVDSSIYKMEENLNVENENIDKMQEDFKLDENIKNDIKTIESEPAIEKFDHVSDTNNILDKENKNENKSENVDDKDNPNNIEIINESENVDNKDDINKIENMNENENMDESENVDNKDDINKIENMNENENMNESENIDDKDNSNRIENINESENVDEIENDNSNTHSSSHSSIESEYALKDNNNNDNNDDNDNNNNNNNNSNNDANNNNNFSDGNDSDAHGNNNDDDINNKNDNEKSNSRDDDNNKNDNENNTNNKDDDNNRYNIEINNMNINEENGIDSGDINESSIIKKDENKDVVISDQMESNSTVVNSSLPLKENNVSIVSFDNNTVNSSIYNDSILKNQEISQLDFSQIIKRNDSLGHSNQSEEERIDNINIQEMLDADDTSKFFNDNAYSMKDGMTDEFILVHSDQEDLTETLNEDTKFDIKKSMDTHLDTNQEKPPELSSDTLSNIKEEEKDKENKVELSVEKVNNNVNINDNKNSDQIPMDEDMIIDPILNNNDILQNQVSGNKVRNEQTTFGIINQTNIPNEIIDRQQYEVFENDYDIHGPSQHDHPHIHRIEKEHMTELEGFQVVQDLKNYSEIEKEFMGELIMDLRNENEQLKEKVDTLQQTFTQLKSQVHTSNLENIHIEEELVKLERKNENLNQLYQKYKDIGFNLHQEIQMLTNEWETIFKHNTSYMKEYKKRCDEKV